MFLKNHHTHQRIEESHYLKNKFLLLLNYHRIFYVNISFMSLIFFKNPFKHAFNNNLTIYLYQTI